MIYTGHFLPPNYITFYNYYGFNAKTPFYCKTMLAYSKSKCYSEKRMKINRKEVPAMKTLRIMWKHMSGNRLIYLGAILCVGLATLTTISGPLVIRLTIDSVIGDEPLTAPLLIRPLVEKISANLWVPGILLVLITTARGLFIFLRGRITAI